MIIILNGDGWLAKAAGQYETGFYNFDYKSYFLDYGFYLQWGIFTQLRPRGEGVIMLGRIAYALMAMATVSFAAGRKHCAPTTQTFLHLLILLNS